MKHAIRGYWQNSRALRLRNIGIIPAAVLLLAGATLGWIAYDEYLQAQESEYRLLEAYARNADVQVTQALDKIENLLNQIAGAQLKGRLLDNKELSAELDLHNNDIPELGALLLTDAVGRIRASTDAMLVGRDLSREPYFSAYPDRAQTPRMFMSRPDKNPHGVTAVTFSLPMVGTDHKFIGIAGATIGFKFFPKVLQAINSEDSESMSVIFNRDGDIVYRRDDSEKFFGFNIAKVSTVFREHASAAMRVTRHIGPSYHDGKTRLFLVHEVGDTGLGLILSRQLDEILAKWKRKVAIYSFMFLFSIAAVVALALSSTRRKKLEADIADSREKLRESEQRQMLSQERQRLMQDMHDGLGSSLISALRVVEHGRMDEADVGQVLKGCIDDLKLAIDSMEPVDADLLLLLATLRYRLGPRLESTGIALRWEVKNVPALDWLDPKNALHILRILQEVFTNIIKHTHATEIRVATGVEGDYVAVTISDNGQGFDVESAFKSGGKGLSNQMRRAESIGAEIKWDSNIAGTCFTLLLPIKRKQT